MGTLSFAVDEKLRVGLLIQLVEVIMFVHYKLNLGIRQLIERRMLLLLLMMMMIVHKEVLR